MSLTPHQIERMQLTTVTHVIAHGYARADIETRLTGELHSGLHAGWWYDASDYSRSEYAEDIGLALRYLQLRGLLLTHPEHEHLVRPLNDQGDFIRSVRKVRPSALSSQLSTAARRRSRP